MRSSVSAAVLAEHAMRAITVKKNEDDAGKAAFTPKTYHSLTALRHRLGQWLNAKSPAPLDRWHDPRSKAHVSDTVKVIETVKWSDSEIRGTLQHLNFRNCSLK